MGVCGCGKSTIGKLLAEATGGAYLEGDSLHPPENIEKMGNGIPLEDTDREGWLRAIRDHIEEHAGPWPLFVGCSALKREYRDLLARRRAGCRGPVRPSQRFTARCSRRGWPPARGTT